MLTNVYKVLVSHEGYATGVTITRPAYDLRSQNLDKAGYLRLMEVVEDGTVDVPGSGVRGDAGAESEGVLNEPGRPEPDLSTEGVPTRRKAGSGRGRKPVPAAEQADSPEESGAPVGLPQAEAGSETFGGDPLVADGDDRD